MLPLLPNNCFFMNDINPNTICKYSRKIGSIVKFVSRLFNHDYIYIMIFFLFKKNKNSNFLAFFCVFYLLQCFVFHPAIISQPINEIIWIAFNMHNLLMLRIFSLSSLSLSFFFHDHFQTMQLVTLV